MNSRLSSNHSPLGRDSGHEARAPRVCASHRGPWFLIRQYGGKVTHRLAKPRSPQGGGGSNPPAAAILNIEFLESGPVRPARPPAAYVQRPRDSAQTELVGRKARVGGDGHLTGETRGSARRSHEIHRQPHMRSRRVRTRAAVDRKRVAREAQKCLTAGVATCPQPFLYPASARFRVPLGAVRAVAGWASSQAPEPARTAERLKAIRRNHGPGGCSPSPFPWCRVGGDSALLNERSPRECRQRRGRTRLEQQGPVGHRSAELCADTCGLTDKNRGAGIKPGLSAYSIHSVVARSKCYLRRCDGGPTGQRAPRKHVRPLFCDATRSAQGSDRRCTVFSPLNWPARYPTLSERAAFLGVAG